MRGNGTDESWCVCLSLSLALPPPPSCRHQISPFGLSLTLAASYSPSSTLSSSLSPLPIALSCVRVPLANSLFPCARLLFLPPSSTPSPSDLVVPCEARPPTGSPDFLRTASTSSFGHRDCDRLLSFQPHNTTDAFSPSTSVAYLDLSSSQAWPVRAPGHGVHSSCVASGCPAAEADERAFALQPQLK